MSEQNPTNVVDGIDKAKNELVQLVQDVMKNSTCLIHELTPIIARGHAEGDREKELVRAMLLFSQSLLCVAVMDGAAETYKFAVSHIPSILQIDGGAGKDGAA